MFPSDIIEEKPLKASRRQHNLTSFVRKQTNSLGPLLTTPPPMKHSFSNRSLNKGCFHRRMCISFCVFYILFIHLWLWFSCDVHSESKPMPWTSRKTHSEVQPLHIRPNIGPWTNWAWYNTLCRNTNIYISVFIAVSKSRYYAKIFLYHVRVALSRDTSSQFWLILKRKQNSQMIENTTECTITTTFLLQMLTNFYDGYTPLFWWIRVYVLFIQNNKPRHFSVALIRQE
jgi:hypothetical protein